MQHASLMVTCHVKDGDRLKVLLLLLRVSPSNADLESPPAASIADARKRRA